MYCCGIIGHRKYNEDIDLSSLLENLIFEEQVDTFNFGTKSQFTSACATAVEKLQKYYPNITMRVFLVRGEFRLIKGQDSWAKMLNKFGKQIMYDEIFEEIFDAGKFSYIERDKAIVDNSDIIFCYCKDVISTNRYGEKTKSGTAMTLEYAKKKNKKIINIATKKSD